MSGQNYRADFTPYHQNMDQNTLNDINFDGCNSAGM